MNEAEISAAVYEGAVTHRRFKPVTHYLKYNVFSFLFDLDQLDATAKRLRFFSRNKFNLFSFYDRDHGSHRPNDLAANIRAALEEAHIDSSGRILLLCYPRMLGYVFNPLSVFYCYDAEGGLVAMIYEVRNTFGSKHAYLIPVRDRGTAIEQQAGKLFHVSPFMDMDMRYDFSLTEPRGAVSVSIQTSDKEGPVLKAAFTGEGADLSDRKLLALFLRYPMMTLKVIFGIHWEAMKLLFKGMTLRPGAPDPDYPMTLVTSGKPVLLKAA